MTLDWDDINQDVNEYYLEHPKSKRKRSWVVKDILRSYSENIRVKLYIDSERV